MLPSQIYFEIKQNKTYKTKKKFIKNSHSLPVCCLMSLSRGQRRRNEESLKNVEYLSWLQRRENKKYKLFAYHKKEVLVQLQKIL